MDYREKIVFSFKEFLPASNIVSVFVLKIKVFSAILYLENMFFVLFSLQ